MKWAPIHQLVDEVLSGKTTALELTQRALAACSENEHYNALITINDNALDAAKAVDTQIAAGTFKGRLAGIPYIAKDNFLTKDTTTTAASNILKDFVPPFNATAIAKIEAEGGILIAKANLDSFAHGGSTENSDMGTTLNPHDTDRVPGGSSGGSATAVVLGLAPFALGTDTGGSVRLPASFTGSVGLKPTYGLVSRYGVIAMASSTDVIGPMANTVEDTALVLEVLAGRDTFDSTSIERNKSSYEVSDGSLSGKKIGVVKEYMGDGVDEEVKTSILAAIESAKAAGAEIVEVSIPAIDLALAVYYVVVPAEISSNLSRYDGIRYGHSTDSAATIDEVYLKSRTEGFGPEVKRRIMIGTYVLSSGYYDAYYKKAQQVRTILMQEFQKAFDGVDLLIGPVAPSTAFKIGENNDDPLKMYLVDVMTVSANLVGIPAISIPSGKDSNGLPIGVQLMAPARHDHELLEAARALELEIGYTS